MRQAKSRMRDKGSGINNLCIQALGFRSDLVDPTEQNRRRSAATLRILRLRIGQRWRGVPEKSTTFGGADKSEMHQCASYLFASPQRGFTLIEILIATSILLVAVAGFLAWTANVVNQRAGLSKRNFAYNIAVDVSDRLAKLSGTNVFLLPNPVKGPSNYNYLGVDYNDANPQNNGNLLTCLGGAITSNTLTSDATGMTIYTNPWNGTMNQLFLYDNNQGDLEQFNTNMSLNTTANAYIDHPNSTDVANLGLPNDINSIINPVRRSANGVTYYVVWSVAYMPCATAPTNLVKIFITVYWIEPQPFSSTVTQVNSYIQSHPFAVKNVSITLDKSLTATQ